MFFHDNYLLACAEWGGDYAPPLKKLVRSVCVASVTHTLSLKNVKKHTYRTGNCVYHIFHPLKRIYALYLWGQNANCVLELVAALKHPTGSP